VVKAEDWVNENKAFWILIAEQSMGVRLTQMPCPARKSDVLGLGGSRTFASTVNWGGGFVNCVDRHAQYSRFSCLHHA